MAGDGSSDVLEHYGDADERGRLDTPLGRVEFERTVEILVAHLPPPPATVAGSTSATVVPTQCSSSARSTTCPRRDRLQALREAGRVVRPGGPVFAAAISRWAPRLHGELVERLDIPFPTIAGQIETVERTGRLPALDTGLFSGYCHRPGQLRAEIRAAGLEMVDLVSVEGIAFALHDLGDRLEDPRGRAIVMNAARELGRVPELLGIGPHMLATARRPGPG